MISISIEAKTVFELFITNKMSDHYNQMRKSLKNQRS